MGTAGVILAPLVCLMGALGVSCATDTPAVDTSSLDATIDEAFSQLVGEMSNVFDPSAAPLKACIGDGEQQQDRCRRHLSNEPGDAKDLFPFLLKDEDAMQMWRGHFRRHVKQVIGNPAMLDDGETSLHIPGLRTLAEGEFWRSRPAVSKGALAHLRMKMDRLKSEAAAQGADAANAVTWEAEVSPRFKYHSIKDAMALMGTYLTSLPNPDKPPMPLGEPLQRKVFSNFQPVEQENFDARDAFPECKGVIGHVRDQGDCGSCWAFGATEALNDRLCIKTGGNHPEMLSPQHTTSCCDVLHCLSLGCNGGQPHLAWRWFSMSGVVTGGDYDELHAGKSCWPYEIPFCSHHSSAGPYPNCDPVVSKTPKCRRECEEEDYSAHVRPFKEDLHFATKPFSVVGRDQIKRELVERGTLSGAFLVFEDFLMYKSGIYHHVTGMPMGGHAIKVIGFGKEAGKEYWLAVNSWNVYWGDKGTFKIQMGEAGIDDEFCGGEAKAPRGDMFLQQAVQDL